MRRDILQPRSARRQPRQGTEPPSPAPPGAARSTGSTRTPQAPDALLSNPRGDDPPGQGWHRSPSKLRSGFVSDTQHGRRGAHNADPRLQTTSRCQPGLTPPEAETMSHGRAWPWTFRDRSTAKKEKLPVLKEEIKTKLYLPKMNNQCP